MRRELDGARHCVDEPAKDHLDLLQRPVPLAEFLDGVGVHLPLVVGRIRRAKDLIDAVKENPRSLRRVRLPPCARRMKSST